MNKQMVEDFLYSNGEDLGEDLVREVREFTHRLVAANRVYKALFSHLPQDQSSPGEMQSTLMLAKMQQEIIDG